MVYETPSCFDMSVSKGSLPCQPCEIGDDHLTPHDGPSIQKVRLVAARTMMTKPRLTVNLSPYEEGLRMGAWCEPQANPYPIGSDAADEWMDGWADA